VTNFAGIMNNNIKGLLIGVVGMAITFSAYDQTVMSSTQCLVLGFFVLLFGLLVKEGFSPF